MFSNLLLFPNDLSPKKFHMPSSNGSLLTVIKQEAKYKFRLATMLLFYITQKCILSKNVYFFKIYFHVRNML
jgi:hypothetical protein